MGLKCPCKGCTDRTVTCHSVCKKYEDWKIEDRAIKDGLRDLKVNTFSEVALKLHLEKMKKKKRGWG